MIRPEWFAARLRWLRADARLSQAALARRAGVTQAAVSLYESGARLPPWDIALRLAAALGVGVESFAERP